MERFNQGMKVAGRAVTYFGSQSISNDTSAIFELVKNSRDADAARVSVSFENLEGDGQRIVIEDDGVGMTYSDIVDKWLVAGTDSKSKNTKSPAGRTVWGEMGIGRFACEKLADRTTMVSYPKDEATMIQMSFDWGLYKKPGVTFDEVKHPGYKNDKDDVSKHGLKLILENLNSQWSERRIRGLSGELGTFILPPELKGPDDVEIVINAERYGIVDEYVKGTIAQTAPLRMNANFDGTSLTIRVSDVNHNKGSLVDRDPGDLPDDISCGPFNFDLYFYPRDKAKRGGGRWESYYKKIKGLNIGDFLSQHAGIYLYRDGVWVKPLGGKNDWLHLEARRVQRRTRLGLSQVYGIIRISHDTNPDIRPTAHRETIQDNAAFQSMRAVTLKSITAFEKYWAERERGGEPDTGGHPPLKLAENNAESLTKTLKDSRDNPSPDAFSKMESDVKALKIHIKSAAKEMDREKKSFGELRNHEDAVAAIGLLTSYMASEVAIPLNNNVTVLADARKAMRAAGSSKNSNVDVAKYRTWMERLDANTEVVLHFVGLVRALSKHIAASVARRGKPTEFDVSEAWNMITGGFKGLTSGLGICVSSYVDGDIRIKSSRIDLEAVLANLFLNAVDALRGKTDGMRQIRFDAAYSRAGLTLKISDNGRGMASKHLDRVFEPFYTVVEEPDSVAHGHGLGLAIVKKLVERHQGSVRAESPSQVFGEGTVVIVSFPSDSMPRAAVV